MDRAFIETESHVVVYCENTGPYQSVQKQSTVFSQYTAQEETSVLLYFCVLLDTSLVAVVHVSRMIVEYTTYISDQVRLLVMFEFMLSGTVGG